MADYNFYGWFTAAKVGKTGLTVTVDVRKLSDNSLAATDQAATEVGGGLYKYVFTSATVGDYCAVFKTADATVDAQQVPSLVTAQMQAINTIAADVWSYITRAVTVVSGTLTTISGEVTVVGPVATGGAVSIIAGDDYASVDGRALTWSSTAWPDLTGATVVCNVDSYATALPMTVTVPGSGSQTVQLELTAAQTTALAGLLHFSVVATLADGNIATLVSAGLVCN